MTLSSKGLRIVGLGVGLFFALVLVAQVIVGRTFSASYLEGFLEENLNARAEVEKVKVNLLARRVTLHGLSLSPLEKVPGPTGVEIGQVRLGVKALPLFSRRLETTSFVIVDPIIRMTLDREGDLSLAQLFSKPDDEGGDAAVPTKEKSGVLEAKENRWLAKLGETRLQGGRVEMTFEKEKMLLKVEDLAITINDLQFDPEDLASLNQVQLNLKAGTRLLDAEGNLLVRMDLDGEATGKLFDEVTGDFDADVIADLALGQDSYLNPQIKIVRRIWGYLDQVEKVGIELGSLPDRIDFGRSRRITGSYREDVVRLTEPLSLSVGKWEVGLARQSWIETHSGRHEIGVEFLAGDQISDTLGGWLDALPRNVQNLAQSRFVDEDQVLWRVNSSGYLENPEFDYLSQLPEAKGLIKELENSFEEEVDKLRDKADDFLRGLLDN
ncbi:AsmA family protein [Roseibacillus persicicus]|uniref:AsmA domain-containing protein n=1 Tax=Roseibacillus persicicus TaxID=454148 RepID=A0A918WFL7_9BACT|nr:AsmA family protein [Roseibacillus persicicus]GHC42596.1 hypothetical protein GCM10007100_04550 [Roseibacillus persicicus]